MALAIDASSPPIVNQTAIGTTTVTTASFTPPANSRVLVLWSGDAPTGAAPASTPAITDSLGSHLIYSQLVWERRSATAVCDGQVAIWTAPVVTSAAMTITVTNGSSNGDSALCVLVITDSGNIPLTGAFNKNGQTTGTTVAATVTATSTGSWVFGVICDWDDVATETAGSGTTQIGTTNTTNVITGFYRRTAQDGVNGSATTLNVNLSTSSANLHWGTVELISNGGGAPAAESRQPAARPGRTWQRRFKHHQQLPPPGPTYPLVETLVDDFSTQDNVKWAGWGANVVWNARGTVDIAVTPSYFGLAATQRYQLTSSSIYAKIYSAPPIVADNSSEMHLACVISPGNEVHAVWTESGGAPRFFMRESVANVNSDAQVTMDPSQVYMRIRESGGSLFWETSPDTVTWTVQRTKVSTLNWSSVQPNLLAGYWGTVTGAGTGAWDSVNTPVTASIVALLNAARRRPRPPLPARRQLSDNPVPDQSTSPVANPRRRPARRFTPVPFVESGTASVTGNQAVPPRPRQQRRPRPVLLPRVDSGTTGPVGTQATPPTAPPVTQWTTGRARRAWLVLRRPGIADPTPPQLNPPIVPLTATRGLRRLLLPARRGQQLLPIQPQAAPTPPPYPPAPARGLRRFLMPARRAAAAEVVQAQQQAVPNPPITQRLTGRPVRFLTPARRARTAIPTPPQFNPAYIPAGPVHALRRFLTPARRPLGRAVPPEQAAPLPPVSGRRRWRVLRRPGVATAPAVAQAAPVNPPYPLAEARGLRRFLVPARRGRAAAPVPPQQAATPNPPYPLAVARGLRRFLAPARRARVATPTPAQQTAPVNPPLAYPVVRGLRRFLTPARRGRAATPVPTQAAAAVNPPITQRTGVARRLAVALRRHPPAAPIHGQPPSVTHSPAPIRRHDQRPAVRPRVASPPRAVPTTPPPAITQRTAVRGLLRFLVPLRRRLTARWAPGQANPVRPGSSIVIVGDAQAVQVVESASSVMVGDGAAPAVGEAGTLLPDDQGNLVEEDD